MLRNVFAQAADLVEDQGKQWNQMSLMRKWQASYKNEEYHEEAGRAASRFANGIFIYLAVTSIYLTLAYTTDFYYGYLGAEAVYYLKVLAVFVFINSVANWLCVKLYDTAYHRSNDRPELQKSLWDDHPIEITTATENGAATAAANGQAKYASEKKTLPWVNCVICQHDAPPRSHHCRACHKCILKRDHHCFLLGVCIGYYNQRYFVVLAFYMIIACLWGYFLIYKYMQAHFFPTADFYDCLLPFTIWRWAVGPISFHHMLMMTNLYFLWLGGFLGVGFFFWQMFVIFIGKTSHEAFHPAVKVKVSSTISQHFRSVFGSFWALNFLFPAVILFRQEQDGTEWKDVHTC